MSQTKAEYRVADDTPEDAERDAEPIFPATVYIIESGTSVPALRRRIAVARYEIRRRELEVEQMEAELAAQEAAS